MWLNAIALVVFLIFAVAGALRGTLATGLKLGSLIAAYCAALFLAPSFAGLAASELSLPRILGIPVAGAIVFAVSYAICGLLTLGLLVVERRNRRERPRSGADRLGGASLGLVRGGLVVFLIGWLALWVDGLRAAGVVNGLPDPRGSVVAEVTQDVVETGGDILLGTESPTGRMATRMMARPAETYTRLERVLDNYRIDELRRDQLFWAQVSEGSYDAALNRGSFVSIAYDETLRREFVALGLARPETAGDARLFRLSMREVLEEVGPRLRGLRDDPELKSLLDDPKVREMVENGDTAGLLRHPGFQRLVQKVTSRSP
jgi:uncharacterized membrane protein required for colicin V production